MSAFVPDSLLTLRYDEQGVIRIGETRVRLDTIVTAWKHGDSPEQIAENFDTVSLAEVYGVISYHLSHRTETEIYLNQNRQVGERIRSENEVRFPPKGVRERLLARREAMKQ